MMTKKRKRWLSLIVPLILLLVIGSSIYLMDYYHASDTAMNMLEHPASDVTILQEDDRIAFVPNKPLAGMIFYPGGKVAYEAYAPLLESCAEAGILCVIPQMPGNLAVLDQNAADGIIEEYPQISNWYLAGHSLGGTIAGIYLSEHLENYQGLILLASYCNVDLSRSDMEVLSIYGSEDGVMNRTAYEKNWPMLPDTKKEVIIEGGCHAYFGNYGEQAGDGSPSITRQEQQRQTVEEIVRFVLPS